MRWLRIAYRLPLFGAITLTLYVLRLAPRLLPGFDDRGQTDREWRSRMFSTWSQLVRRLIGMNVHVSGPLPKGSSFVVTNHLGYVDILLLSGFFPAVFVAKSDIAGWPLLGRAVRATGAIFVDRNSRFALPMTIEQMSDALAVGDTVVLFPEGTSSAGLSVLPIKPSLLQVPATLGVPVTYAAIRYRTPPGSPDATRAVAWWGDMPFLGHFLNLLGLPGFDAYLRFGTEAVVDDDRKRLARRLHESIGIELAAATG